MGNKYRALAAELRKRLADGEFSGDAPFPSETALASRYGMSRATVRRALADLEGAGLLSRRQGVVSKLTAHGKAASGKIGLLFPDISHIDVFPVMTHEILRVGGRWGYSFVLSEIAGETSVKRGERTLAAIDELIAQRVEGVIFRSLVSEKCADVNKMVLERLGASQIPVVMIDCGVPECGGHDVVGVDNLSAGRTVGEHLVACGRKRVAFLLNSLPIGPTDNLRDRMFGVSGAVVAAGLPWTSESLLPCAEYDLPGLRRYFRRCRADRPDAIVCGSDNVAIGLIRSLAALGYSVPDDIAVVGFDDAPYAALSTPALTTVRQPFAEMAKTAFARLVQRIRNPNMGPCTLHLPAELVVRDTSGRRKSRSR